MTTIGSQAGSQALGEVCHRLVDVFLWQLSKGLQSDFELISHLELQLELVYGTFPTWRSRRDSPLGSNLESLGQ